MRAPRPGERVAQENALKPRDRLWPWMSQLSQQGVFKMTKVLSVSARAKVWEIQNVAERFVIWHQHKKISSISVIHLTGGGGVFSYVVTIFFYLPMPARKFLILWHITIFAVHALCGDIVFLCSYHTVGCANFLFFTFTQYFFVHFTKLFYWKNWRMLGFSTSINPN